MAKPDSVSNSTSEVCQSQTCQKQFTENQPKDHIDSRLIDINTRLDLVYANLCILEKSDDSSALHKQITAQEEELRTILNQLQHLKMEVIAAGKTDHMDMVFYCNDYYDELQEKIYALKEKASTASMIEIINSTEPFEDEMDDHHVSFIFMSMCWPLPTNDQTDYPYTSHYLITSEA